MRPLVSATIDSAALRHNLEVVRRRAPGSRVMAVVKANAYGHGLVAVARALPQADSFAVARVEEGLALRQAGITQTVVLLEGVFDPEQLRAAAQAGFELVVHSPEQIGLLREAGPGAVAAGGAAAAGGFTIWLKLDTGMNRLGLKGLEFATALAALKEMPCVRRPVRLMTHMACADDPLAAANGLQIALFQAATGGEAGARSLANSATILNFPNSLVDWVRPGLLLYGVSPLEGTIGADFDLRPAMTLQSHVIAVKDVAAGEQVGYGGTWTARRSTRLAVAAVGYGDGYPRSLGAGAPALVNGRRAPLAGRVSMDMTGIDVTDLNPPVAVGDPVQLWGPRLPVEEIAVWAGTIPYELLCGISQRVFVALT